jgi:hypothetical protein
MDAYYTDGTKRAAKPKQTTFYHYEVCLPSHSLTLPSTSSLSVIAHLHCRRSSCSATRPCLYGASATSAATRSECYDSVASFHSRSLALALLLLSPLPSQRCSLCLAADRLRDFALQAQQRHVQRNAEGASAEAYPAAPSSIARADGRSLFRSFFFLLFFLFLLLFLLVVLFYFAVYVEPPRQKDKPEATEIR